MKKLASAGDPLWYKDAIIYELHVRAFADSNNDGIGDFQGLISKLDYLQDLGVTCLWLLPFFPSPLRDDGYDIANYVDVNPAYGTLGDFKQFLDEAHRRNMQVMIELVINHTSDQHPWFKAARQSAPGSPEREMYVWSNTDQLYKDARIIFTDTEKSNWTWDEAAQAYYWHRFFSHQPDLNFDNPRVIEEVLNAMRFWLDMGVDALRMDAIPYLVERDNTSCENLPETHSAIKKIRAAIDADYANRLVLAEANQWPADVRPYFGDGDECHMAFHFPLMPRIYMALRQEDRLPITDIMAQTPAIPDSCQWGLFLRNHDELTLEMVTDDERDYMYLAYSSDPRMRINVGIRRRLAPLVDNNRRRIELLNSLLLSFPGTPIMYYGDEIGMGDNIYLGDRNGVRTPMQWNSDRNAGFSRCDPARLYFPVIMDPIYGYQVVNVEAQLSDQSSLLHWTRNMIALRKLFQVFGRGTLEFLNPENRTILAYLRKLEREDGSAETVLCVANLSRFAQPVSLDMKEYAGAVPVEMLGYVTFPTITTAPYPLTVAPYSFLWFELQPSPHTSLEDGGLPAKNSEEMPRITREAFAKGWEYFATAEGAALLEAELPKWLPNQRWFGSKSRQVERVQILSAAILGDQSDGAKKTGPDWRTAADAGMAGASVLIVDVHYVDSSNERYQLPVAMSLGRDMEEITEAHPQSVIVTLMTPNGPAILHDAKEHEGFRNALLSLIESNQGLPLKQIGESPADHGQAASVLRGDGSQMLKTVHLDAPMQSRVGTAEQSNTSILYADKMILKLFRRLQPGINPDIEVGRFLTEVAHFKAVPPMLGEIRLETQGGGDEAATSLAMLQELVPHEGDGWLWTMNDLARFYESLAGCPAPEEAGSPVSFLTEGKVPKDLWERDTLYLDAAGHLGRRTGELHLALASDTDDVRFKEEPITTDDLELDAERAERQIAAGLGTLRRNLHSLSEPAADDAAAVLSRRLELLTYVGGLRKIEPSGKRIRIHGDYHLGQVLRTRNDFMLIDFEGEPARPLEERRRKQSPLKDVAGMLRSFSYAAWSALDQYAQRYPDRERNLQPWAQLWINTVSNAFLKSYRTAVAVRGDLLPEGAQADALLQGYMMEKAFYELTYELNNRPAWVRVPLAGILALRIGA
ncbi:maltose alpha-D-glucosyltransferase [Granulicella sp. 5B5]|uniref:maltose alpha-D-glucosyltransferase n=1 Tax=Granulicella sp. 5B5 TaxID=1617967 RepID=UPI0015F43435|nr:maltose alpha-D-glucosyltransferase [Granulicella sp. 5B5]QMV17285.1 maltose alpha-D-glucosyltransferase [Granulicella sp. 5B5]